MEALLYNRHVDNIERDIPERGSALLTDPLFREQGHVFVVLPGTGRVFQTKMHPEGLHRQS